MMMNSIASMTIVLTALVCLWITPTISQTIAIQQSPSPVALGKPTTLMVTGVNTSEIVTCAWYKGSTITDDKLIGVYSYCTNYSSTTTSPKIDENCTLKFDAVSQGDVDMYIVHAVFNTTAKTARKVLNGAERFEMSSIVLLAAAGLISSFTLF